MKKGGSATAAGSAHGGDWKTVAGATEWIADVAKDTVCRRHGPNRNNNDRNFIIPFDTSSGVM